MMKMTNSKSQITKKQRCDLELGIWNFPALRFSEARGLTLIELLIVVSIFGILAGLSVSAFPKARESASLSAVAETTAALLSRARAETLAGKNGAQHGVYIDGNEEELILFSGSTYDENATVEETAAFPQEVVLQTLSLASTASNIAGEVVFARLSGDTGDYGTLTFALADDASRIRTVTITQSGAISVD